MGLSRTTVVKVSQPTCWICGAASLKLLRARTVPPRPTSVLFRVTDASYGQTFTIHRCEHCGFLQCMDAEDVISHYVGMSDGLYVGDIGGPRASDAIPSCAR